MSEANNGQSLPKQGNYTGERLARQRPRIYRACHVTRESVRAVERREAESISARKQELAASAARVAQASIEQLEDDVAAGKIKGAQLVPVFGVCVDKLQALSGDPALRIAVDHAHAHIHAHINEHSYTDLLSRLPRRNHAPEDTRANDQPGA